MRSTDTDCSLDCGAAACSIYTEANGIFQNLQDLGRVSSFDLATGGWTTLRKSISKHCKV